GGGGGGEREGEMKREVVGEEAREVKRERLPDPFAKVVVDGSGQCHSTDTVKSTLDPKWNQHYDL
uniref:C2 domain-containing protein n=1 Tax=Salmo trutta TaxID=8032 RepID=A0A674D9Z5_SALTR